MTETSLNDRKLIKLFLDKNYEITFPNFSTINIPNLENQLIILNNLLVNLQKSLKYLNIELIEDVIKQHIKHFTSEKLNKVDYDILIIGTTGDIQNRILATESRNLNKPVIVIHHGEACGQLDEPVIGYGEFSHATHNIGYGEVFKKIIKNKNEYLASIYEYGDYITTNANKVKRIYKKIF